MNKNVRWLPAIVAPILVIGVAITVPTVANAASTPPQKTAQQVLALISDSKDSAYSGTIQQHSDLGLPQLPSTGPGSSTGTDSTSQLLDLLTADHTARVFVDGANKQRVQVLDNLAERDVIRNGSEVWTYDSKTKSATHMTLPATSAKGSGGRITGPVPNDPDAQTPDARTPDAQTLTPAQLADRAIRAITPSTDVAVTATASVAGRSVYQLELTPKAGTTLVSHVVLSVDAATGLPLKVVIDARGQKSDAFSVGFRSIDFSTPAASLFDFTPPKGAKVTTPKPMMKPDGPSTDHTAHPKPTVTGTGWGTIVELPAAATGKPSSGPASGSVSADQTRLLDELTTVVPGGRALQTSLLSVLLLDDGRVLIGAVPVSSLEVAAQ